VQRIVVGELELSDRDEQRRDAVTGTFVARNLAPGDRAGGWLEIYRESVDPAGPADEPCVDMTIDGARGSALAEQLIVDELSYGDQDLEDRARSACGQPLSLARLSACSQQEANPLAGLSDPTP